MSSDRRRRVAARVRRWSPGTVVALVVAVVVLVWSIAYAAREPSRLRITDAADTTVELPDGETVEGFAGVALPDGAEVVTGADGFALVGDTRLGPDSTAAVVDGELVPDP
ncbi:MAG: hypothetical protein R3A49_05000 [Acidimicrobiia bacterium]